MERVLVLNEPTENVFCPTGKGGGIDPTCPAGGEGAATNPQSGGTRSIKYKGQDAKVEPVGDGTFKIVEGPEGSVGKIIRPKVKEAIPAPQPASKTKSPKSTTQKTDKAKPANKLKSREEAEETLDQLGYTLKNKGGLSEEEFLEHASVVSGEATRIRSEFKGVDAVESKRISNERLDIGTDFAKEQNTSRQEKRESSYSGVYRPGTGASGGALELSNRLPIDPSHVPTIGEFDVGKDLATTFRHEFGHQVYHQPTFAGKRKQWDRKFKDMVGTSVVSKYGGTNTSELFAESFSAYTSANYKRGSLPPQIETWMDTNVRG